MIANSEYALASLLAFKVLDKFSLIMTGSADWQFQSHYHQKVPVPFIPVRQSAAFIIIIIMNDASSNISETGSISIQKLANSKDWIQECCKVQFKA